jgi:hypothetical protein
MHTCVGSGWLPSTTAMQTLQRVPVVAVSYMHVCACCQGKG